MTAGLFAAVSFLAFANLAAAREPIASVNHIPIAVKDLDTAGADYRELGFTLKPGRLHDNSLNNLHAKYPDGTELELITATQPLDDLARSYLADISAGDGPAFLALQADFEELARVFDAAKIPYQRGSYNLKVADSSLDYLFFGGDNRSPTDKPEHFAHANGSTSLVAAWIADLENPQLIELLTALGATFTDAPQLLPDGTGGRIAHLRHSEIRLLPRSKRLIADRPIIGATLSAAGAQELSRRWQPAWWVRGRAPGDGTIVLKPSQTHGLWLEFQSR